MNVNIPFLPKFENDMLSGRKTKTSRMKCYGLPADTFLAFGQLFKILSVMPVDLEDVAIVEYEAEGFDSPAEFISTWKEIHPRMGYQPDRKVYLHEFRRVA